MSVSEFERHQIFQWLEEAMSPERAAIMMRLLPPVGWGDIATRGDLELVRGEVKAEIAGLKGEMRATSAELLHRLYFALVASQATLVGLVFAAVRVG